jgi:hypothetical protein
MSEDLIPVGEAAKRLNRHKNSLFKVLSRLGIETTLIRSEEFRGQATAHIKKADFEILRTHITDSVSTDAADEDNAGGYFYIIQLEPDLDPCRLKLGFATSVDDRLRKHRTAAPYSKVLRFWPCKSLWEKTAIDCIAVDAEQIHTEVFQVSDLNETIAKAEAFFAMMPSS